MKKFLVRIMLFLLIGLLLGEIIARTFVLTTDIPMRMINDNQIQKYIPGQQGNWKGGTHRWQINELGWAGPLPDGFDNLITIIGDSFIENFMNPDSCHQSVLLKKELPRYNFLEVSRSGVSFIEALEITKEVDSLNPKFNLVYVSDSDFEESIKQIKSMPDVTQLNLETKKIEHGVLKAPGIKKVLYNWKFLFYLYRRFPLSNGNNKNNDGNKHSQMEIDMAEKEVRMYDKLYTFAKSSYNLDNIIIIFRPKTSKAIVELAKKHGLKYLLLNDSNDRSWSFDHDHHWTCYGHKKVSGQVAKFVQNLR